MNNQNIGDFIKELRKEKGLTQKALADKLNITDRAVSKWERGLSCPDISILDDLSKILDVSIIEILKGKKLDEDTIINNQDLIESMVFTDKKFKNKMKKIVDMVGFFIISFVVILLLFYNVKSFYYAHKVYKVDNKAAITNVNSKLNDINENIILIENNQGIYTDEEYELILEFINDFKYLSNKSIEKELLNKNSININDIDNFLSNTSLYDVYGYDGLGTYKDIYKTILKYNIDKYDNMLNYNRAQSLFVNSLQELTEMYYPIYKYGHDLKEGVPYASYVNMLINLKYSCYNVIINDIVEVGEIYE